MKVIAHRGSSQVAPENTYPAIRRAIQDHVDGIEIDVQLTKDQELVVIHDEWLNRTTNGKGFVFNTTSAQIKKLDAGSWFNKKYKGTTVPLLEEVLEWVKPYSLELHIELKNNLLPYKGMEEKVIRILNQHNLEKKAVLSSFRRESLEICRKIHPTIRTGYLCWSTLLPLLEQSEWDYLHLDSIHPHISLLDHEVTLLKNMGYRIYPYVIQRKHELKKCLRYQVDGIFTGSPNKAKQIIRETTT
ncbi:glycerophosphodiester phosphodiesterase [Bacillus horti]|uniref:Glycerophosphoryl diester phosphodiesterase n=1 Tax=Caldalkalibacillus horti TaxID=77523 RepID=A0ABT9W3M8_9BACI|nr:glycerophosphodiester phosphodiesterase [Bacillus horti]MDQ0167859.1 glycerophosphoryl diester phosphodiesterase [Bacillus horti]